MTKLALEQLRNKKDNDNVTNPRKTNSIELSNQCPNCKSLETKNNTLRT